MALSGWSTTNKLSINSAFITAVPLTIACWGFATTISVDQHMVGFYNSGSTGDLNQFSLGVGLSNRLQAKSGNGSTGVFSSTSNSVTANTWFCAVGYFSSTTSRTSILNNGTPATNTTLSTPTGINRTSIGNRNNSTNDRPFNGSICEVGIWNDILDAGEITAYNKGVSPALIRPQNLMLYIPMVNGIVDLKGNGLTMGGTLSYATHAPIFSSS